MTFITPGTPRIALLNSDGVTYASVNYLPPPDANNGMQLEWEEKNQTKVLIDGSEATRRLGWVPNLTLRWTVYNDVLRMNAYPIGSANGDQLDIISFLALLDNPCGSLYISPGPSAGGFVVQTTKISPIGIVTGSGIAAGVEINFRGGSIYSSKVLGAF
jgi:hypothetical protein